MNSSFERREAAVMGALTCLGLGIAAVLFYLTPQVAHHIPNIF